MDQQKLIKPTPEQRVALCSELAECMDKVRELDALRRDKIAKHKEWLATNTEEREPYERRANAILDDLKVTP